MNQNQSSKKVIWAVDAFEESTEVQGHVLTVLKKVSEALDAEIEPVYVLSPEQLDLPLAFFSPSINQYRPAAEKALETLTREIPIKKLLPPNILVQNHPSLRHTIHTLNTYGLAAGARFIIVGTHARQGLPRLFLGSFSETLLLESKVPVMVVGPTTDAKYDLKQILYPTDFTDRGISAYGEVLNLARELSAKITLLHVIPHPADVVLQSGVYLLGGGWVPVPVFLEKEEAAQQEKAQRWLEKARNAGVSVDLVIEKNARSVVTSILEYAEQTQAGMIAMSAHRGTVSTTIIGSVTREVVRHSNAPVLVLRSPEE